MPAACMRGAVRCRAVSPGYCGMAALAAEVGAAGSVVVDVMGSMGYLAALAGLVGEDVLGAKIKASKGCKQARGALDSVLVPGRVGIVACSALLRDATGTGLREMLGHSAFHLDVACKRTAALPLRA